jgi:hypothetical protein
LMFDSRGKDTFFQAPTSEIYCGCTARERKLQG